MAIGKWPCIVDLPLKNGGSFQLAELTGGYRFPSPLEFPDFPWLGVQLLHVWGLSSGFDSRLEDVDSTRSKNQPKTNRRVTLDTRKKR